MQGHMNLAARSAERRLARDGLRLVLRASASKQRTRGHLPSLLGDLTGRVTPPHDPMLRCS